MGGQKECTFCSYKVYTKHFIWKYPFSKVLYVQRSEFGTTKYMSIPTIKKLSAKIVPHIPSAMRDLGVIIENLYDLVVLSLRMQTLQLL